MSDIDLAVRRAKRLEHRLRHNFGVRGRGLHELVDAAKARRALPNPLVRRLRFIATVRNRIVHDDQYTQIDDRAGFISACDDAEREMDELASPRDHWRATIFIASALAFALLAGIAAAVFLLLREGVPLR